MTDEELAEIEGWFRVGTIYGFTKQGSAEASEKAHFLIAEVRRLRAENERLEREHATYAEVKTDRNLELKERVNELTEEVDRLRKQRSEFEKGIRI